MKFSKKIISFLILFFAINTISAQQLQQFHVKGNCEMCKTRIETAAKKAGARAADWNIQTKQLTIDFDATTSAEKILQEIANVGHDNVLFRAKDANYEQLPECCLYPRDEKNETPETASTAKEKTPYDDHNHHDGHQHSEREKRIDGVKIVKAKAATAIDNKSAGLTFNIHQKELLKAACCNLSESFETNATVDVSFTNAVTGTKQLKMLGLDQKYTALTKEQLPEIRGLASAYGLNFIPGRWIGGIQLTKGGSTVVNGYESITGQINTELLKDKKNPETDLNLFADINARTEVNITHISPLNEKWEQSILLHGNTTTAKRDYNEDGILDQPTGNQINIAYLLNFNDLEKSGWASEFGITGLTDKRFSGQINYDRKLSQAEQTAYGIGIETERFQVWNKTGHIFKNKPYQSVGLMNQFTYHKQDSFFGHRKYFGEQISYYSNFIFESIISDTRHKYKTGASFLYDHYNEFYATQPFSRIETVPGAFAEYTHTAQKFTLVAGARVDFHNLAGIQFTPRLNFKYDITPQSIIRLSVGKGFRTANIFAENQAYFASNRQLEILNKDGKIYGLAPEIAWNYGMSFQQEMKLFGRKSTLLLDFFRTDFQKQVLLDLDLSAHKMVFYNLDGKSFANSFQTQWDFTLIRNLDFRIAYKYYDVQADYSGGRRAVPFMAKHRGFLNIAYTTPKKEGKFWSLDTTLNIVGKQKLPVMTGSLPQYQLPEYSSAFTTLNAQISRHFSENTRIYIGGENLTGTMQKNPIIDAKNPFGSYFDGSMVYAPIMPANAYFGIDVRF